MGSDAPGPGEELNTSPTQTPPRQAASVIVLRDGADGLELLLCKRTERARFMGGVWVFPGGAVDTHEGDGDRSHRLAAARELREEAGLTLDDPGQLVKFSQWITPAEVKIRYDTHFFLASLPDGQEPEIDGDEIVDHGWFTPRAALAAHAREQILLVFPTIKHLEQLAPFTTTEDLLLFARGRDVVPVQPKVIIDGETARVLLPGDVGYAD